MIALDLNTNRNQRLSILCLGAHADDIEIGCGGTILRLLGTYRNCDVTWVVFSATAQRRREALSTAKRFLKDAQRTTVMAKAFKESFFPYRGEEIKGFFEQLKKRLVPDLIFTHYRQDLHQDHRMICELTWNTFRKHQIFEYEVPKYDGDLGSPNLFVELDETLCRRKVDHILTHFKTQKDKHWFSKDIFMAMLRLRGMECNAPSTFAEGFYCRKLVL